MNASDSRVGTYRNTIKVNSTTAPQFIDVTDEVQLAVENSKLQDGLVTVFTRHTTTAVIVQENEPLLLEDFKEFLGRIAPSQGNYRHNDFSRRTVHMHEDECPNGHSHCQQLFLGSSETIPLIEGKMPLGEWQRIFMVELDGEKANMISHREVVVQVLGY